MRICLPNRWVSAASLALLFYILGASASAQQGIDQSRLVVAVSLRNGKLEVSTTSQRTLFSPTLVFSARLRKSLSIPDIQRILVADVDRALGRLPKLYWYALSDAERQLDAGGQLNDQTAANALRDFTGDWATYTQKFNAWVSAGDNRL